MAVSSGEPLPVALLARMQAVLPASVRILNLYGCTEVAADCTCLDATSWLQQAQQVLDLALRAGRPPSALHAAHNSCRPASL